ncbi:CIA30 family protein [Thiohalophilus sp.]|uniref:CIA30 family protein n=1 Tax=Thiohalophilus sp. TaxID=3028392 RepID=UPI0039766BC0
MASQDINYIDTRDSGNRHASSGNQWRLITDQVMGGVSQGQLNPDTVDGQPCLHMQGDVSLENNGGFVQIGLDLSNEVLRDVSAYTGLMLEVYGNNEQYNVHLRTADIWLPWQSYRATFTATPQWQTIFLPFADFEPHRISTEFDITHLERIGLVAIGRQFRADLCIGKIGFYR